MADESQKRSEAKAIQVNEPVPGHYITWAIGFKLEVPAEGMTREEAARLSEAFSEKVLALVDAPGESVDVCKPGAETVRTFEYALEGARMVAHAKATVAARNN